MDDERLTQIAALLGGNRVLTLGVLVDGAPVLGLLPFALSPKSPAEGSPILWVHASRLARHTRGLVEGAAAAVLVHQEGAPAAQSLEVPRLSLEVEVGAPDKGTETYAAAQARYLARFPQAAVTFTLGDFRLFALRPRRGRLVMGFGRAWDVSPEALAAAWGRLPE